jgi:hypothetical protein
MSGQNENNALVGYWFKHLWGRTCNVRDAFSMGLKLDSIENGVDDPRRTTAERVISSHAPRSASLIADRGKWSLVRFVAPASNFSHVNGRKRRTERQARTHAGSSQDTPCGRLQ